MTPMTWYKFARPDGWDFRTGQTINYRTALGMEVRCTDYAPTKECGAGLHISTQPNDCFVGARMPCSAYLVEPTKGLLTIDARKSKVQSLRVIEEITDLNSLLGWDYTGLCAFLETIPQIRWFRPDKQPDTDWHLTVCQDWTTAWECADPAWDAACLAAWDAACLAARDAARDATWDAATNAATNAAWSAARDAACLAARDAARVAAWDAAWSAARDASWVATLYVCAGLPLAPAHAAHFRARWNVWQKGYALLGDVNGCLYVYAAEEPQP